MAKFKVEERFGTVPNSLLNNSEMSLKAKGLFAYMQSKPENWEFSVDKIAIQCKESRDSIRKILNELEEFNYLQRTKYQDELGHWHCDYTLSIPRAENTHEESSRHADIPSKEKPYSGNPFEGKHILYSNKDISKKELSKKENSKKDSIVDEKSTEILNVEVEEVFEEEKKEPEVFLKNKIEKIEKGCAEKEQKEKGEYRQYIGVYNDFFVELNGMMPKIDASDWRALKSLISHCKVLGIDKGSDGLKVFEAIVNVSNWKYLDAYTQKQITIRQINSCFNSIVTQLRNHKKINKTPNKYIDGLIEANKINQQKIKDGTFNDDPFKDILQYKS